MIEIALPYTPRWYFKPFHNRTERFAAIVAHRRCGKTVATINDLFRRATSTDDPGLFAYIAPTYSQAKTVAWDYLLQASAPLLPYGAQINQSELRVTLPNGSSIRLFGADNYNALRGLSLAGCVLDEYPHFDPRAWTQVIRPALSDRQGFATFIGTPAGHDNFYRVYTDACGDAEWFTASIKASDVIGRNDALPVERIKAEHWLTSAELEQARKQIPEEEYRQEYECDFEAAIKGAYYGKQMAAAQAEGRITNVPYDPSLQVITAWDIGGDRDATAIWFVQIVGKQICLIDYHEGIGADSSPYAKLVLEKPYSYAQHFLPHDAGPNRIGIDKSYRDFLSDHGLRNITVLPVAIREHGINLARLLLPRCVFDAKECERGIEALKLYRADYDEKNRVLKASPVHDWASHGADAFRYLATGLDKHVTTPNFNRKINYPKGFY